MATSHCSVGVAVDAVLVMVAEVTASRPDALSSIPWISRLLLGVLFQLIFFVLSSALIFLARLRQL